MSHITNNQAQTAPASGRPLYCTVATLPAGFASLDPLELTGDHLASLGSLKVVDHFLQKCRNIKDTPGGRHTPLEEHIIRALLALRANIDEVGDMVSVNSGLHDPLRLTFGQIDQIRSLDLVNLYISMFVEKCGVNRPRSRNDSQIDSRLQIHRYRLEHLMAAVAAAESAAAAKRAAEIAAGDTVVGGLSRNTWRM